MRSGCKRCYYYYYYKLHTMQWNICVYYVQGTKQKGATPSVGVPQRPPLESPRAHKGRVETPMLRRGCLHACLGTEGIYNRVRGGWWFGPLTDSTRSYFSKKKKLMRRKNSVDNEVYELLEGENYSFYKI